MFQKWLPVINEEECTGCEACILECSPGSLQLVDVTARLVNADSCGSDEHCIAPCPVECIRMDWVEAEGDHSRGLWREVASA